MGVQVVAPDLNSPSFEKLDFDAMVETAAAASGPAAPDVIVGSSLGALVALELARRGMRAPLVLVAPAIGVDDLWFEKIPEGDPLIIFNYAEEREMPIHRAFFDRIVRVRPWAEAPPVRTAVIMGRDDDEVPFDRVAGVWREWEASGLLVLGSSFVEIPRGDHRLIDHMETIASLVMHEIDHGRS